jgi:hypothetical protein
MSLVTHSQTLQPSALTFDSNGRAAIHLHVRAGIPAFIVIYLLFIRAALLWFFCGLSRTFRRIADLLVS